MLKKILIANRGEIAVRVARACREMGIRSVAVYSEIDGAALHVSYADEAWPIGPSFIGESYLSIPRILEAAKRSGADAVHPGYGFLSENPAFARACRDAGLVFIGPSPEAMERMGLKTQARQTMEEAGVPIVPGTKEPLASEREAVRAADSMGWPVLLKASAGGGGKGMRVVCSSQEMAPAFRSAESEAKNAFGHGALYLERWLEAAHHIEIQILGDGKRAVSLGERECSIQRRHQKVVEECPSPFTDDRLRAAMGEAAIRAALYVGYEGAGTVEFLVDAERRFYFLEMNTRIQVEHAVTEMATGVDLVREQIRLAAGEPLSLREEDAPIRGAAIECRIYAEDPQNDFLPCPGRITRYHAPGGPGVRVDSGVAADSLVPAEYDPMVSKLIAWGRDRREAIERCRRAVGEYRIGGIRTTLAFHRRALQNADFLRGRYDTSFIQKHEEELFASHAEDAESRRTSGDAEAALVAAAVAKATSLIGASSRAPLRSLWREAARRGALRR